MAAAFSLIPTGPEAPCDFPGCVLDCFHEGDHVFRQHETKPLPGTRYFNCSECRRECVIYGERLYGETKTCGRQECLVSFAQHTAPQFGVYCSCPQRQYAHELSIHADLRQESFNPKFKFQWPWSLMLSTRVEPSTERRKS